MINECTAAYGIFDDRRLIIKNRDKSHRPTIEVKHEIVDGTELLYYQDLETSHLEGINENGVGVVYTTTNFQPRDEADSFSDCVDTIKSALSKKSTNEIISTLANMNGGVKGVTIVSTPEGTYQIENSGDVGSRKAVSKIVQPRGWHVVTNIPSMLSAGTNVSSGENYICCKIRQAVAEASLFGVEDLDEALESLAYKYFGEKSHNNVTRDSDYTPTCMQIGMDLNSNKLSITKIPNKVNSLKYSSSLPVGYSPKCEFVERSFVEPSLAPFKLFTTNIDESIQRFNLVNYLIGDGPESELENLDLDYSEKLDDMSKIQMAQKAADELWEKERILVSLVRKLNADPIFFTAGHTSNQVKKELELLEAMIKKINSDYEKLLDFIHVERYGTPMSSIVEAARKPRKKGQKAGSSKHDDLYTDEDPKGTIKGLGFKDASTAKKGVAIINKARRTHAHKVQATLVMKQRAKVAKERTKDPEKKKNLNSAYKIWSDHLEKLKAKTKKMKEGSR